MRGVRATNTWRRDPDIQVSESDHASWNYLVSKLFLEYNDQAHTIFKEGGVWSKKIRGGGISIQKSLQKIGDSTQNWRSMFLRVLAFIANPEVRDAYSVRYIWRGDSHLTTGWVADPEVRSCWRHYPLISAFSWIRISMYFTRHLDTFMLNWHFGKNNVYFGRIGRLVPPGGDSMRM